jgi:hypothetical protein
LPYGSDPIVAQEQMGYFCEYTCGFTQFGNRSPFNPAIKFCAAIIAILSRVARLALAMCGAMITLSSEFSG